MFILFFTIFFFMDVGQVDMENLSLKINFGASHTCSGTIIYSLIRHFYWQD